MKFLVEESIWMHEDLFNAVSGIMNDIGWIDYVSRPRASERHSQASDIGLINYEVQKVGVLSVSEDTAAFCYECISLYLMILNKLCFHIYKFHHGGFSEPCEIGEQSVWGIKITSMHKDSDNTYLKFDDKQQAEFFYELLLKLISKDLERMQDKSLH